ncbi:hypothetical protein [Streptomyces sp. NPDC001678]|uniref:hypothetical protein n=1 Tax=Streptomyces sp. NPDC001678 TaxID=3364599 RepID=UPI0036A49D75
MALGSLLLVGSSVVWAPAGQAGTGEGGGGRWGGDGRWGITCTGSSMSHYDPPLTLTPHPSHVHADIRYDSCTIAPGHTVPATGSFDSDLPEPVCIELAGGNGVESVHYADGHKSLIVYDSATTARAAGLLILEQSGHVKEGRGKGHLVRRTVTGPPHELPTDCLTSGLRGGGNGVQLEIQP